MSCNHKLVVCLKVDGKVLREHGDVVYVPYSSEFSIYVKNLNSVRASVSIEIDGKNIFSDGSTLVVHPNSDTFVERFVTNNERGNKFKFIEKTSKISEHRGDKAEDGLVRIAFKYERLPVIAPTTKWESITRPRDILFGTPQGSVSKGPLRGFVASGSSGMHLNSVQSDYRNHISAQTINTVAQAQSLSTNENGITVEGAISDQKFKSISAFPLETTEHVMVLKMLGELGQNKPVEQAVTVKRKVKCITCGTSNKGSAKFCSDCGTAVELI